MKETYFVLSDDEDGTRFREIKDVDRFLKDSIDDEIAFLPELPKTRSGQFEPCQVDEALQGRNIAIIIKGVIVVPKKVKVITKLELP